MGGRWCISRRGSSEAGTGCSGLTLGWARTLRGMRLYEVQPGDSPGSIAAEFAGCPKCSRDLVAEHPERETITFPNGYKTFKQLRAGEKLRLPDKWFTPEFDQLPPAYFASLPHYDGVTPSKLGLAAAGILGDYATLDAASVTAAALSAMSDQSFSNAADALGTLLDQSVHEADGSTNPGIAAYAAAVHIATTAARQRNADLVTALNAGDQAGAAAARADVQKDLLTAVDSARLALQAVYGADTTTAKLPTQFPAVVVAAAQAAAAAIASNPSYCTLMSQPGNTVNSAMHVFKTAWNAANPTNPVPVGTGNYEQSTADVLTRVLGAAAPAACPAQSVSTASSPPVRHHYDVTPPQDPGMSFGSILGIGLIGAGAVGAAIYFAMNRPHTPVRRARPRKIRKRFEYDPEGYHRDDTILPTEEEEDSF
jgi:hypothetical protein